LEKTYLQRFHMLPGLHQDSLIQENNKQTLSHTFLFVLLTNVHIKLCHIHLGLLIINIQFNKMRELWFIDFSFYAR
jgi:hypothetical protein